MLRRLRLLVNKKNIPTVFGTLADKWDRVPINFSASFAAILMLSLQNQPTYIWYSLVLSGLKISKLGWLRFVRQRTCFFDRPRSRWQVNCYPKKQKPE